MEPTVEKAAITGIFNTFQKYANDEQDVRETIRKIVKEIEKSTREIVTVLQVIHQEDNTKEVHSACKQAKALFKEVSNGFQELEKVIPEGEYYRYHDHWKYATQRLAFLTALIVFLENGTLIDKETSAEMMGITSTQNIHLDFEDYLLGLLNLASELSRYAVNSVTYGDYKRPVQISKFVAELNAGFRLLNLKNDSLRKKFDALKYDVKKIEEVVYDLSIRGLLTSNPDC